MSERTAQGAPSAPAELTYDSFEVDLLNAWYDEDADDVDTAVIPRLQVSETVLVPVALPEVVPPVAAFAAPASRVPTQPTVAAPAPRTPSPASAPATSRTRHRHASEQSLAAVRRNLVAVAAIVTGAVLLGSAVGIIGGWVALVGYVLLVGGLVLARRRVNARYAPRHSRYVARHA